MAKKYMCESRCKKWGMELEATREKIMDQQKKNEEKFAKKWEKKKQAKKFMWK